MRTIQDIKLIPIRDYLTHRGAYPKQENSRYGFYLSPLRDEQDASFKVDYTQNLWYDFGAGRGGSIIDLVMEIEKCNFQQAVERLRSQHLHHIHQLTGMANNLNQISRKANAVGYVKVRSEYHHLASEIDNLISRIKDDR